MTAIADMITDSSSLYSHYSHLEVGMCVTSFIKVFIEEQ